MKLKQAVFLISLLLASVYCQSQNKPIGQWTDYLSYHQGLTVCQGGGNIYCCCSSGVFAYNISDNSLQRYNKVTGLSDIGCTVARYSPYTNMLVIGYSDGNIDVMANNQVINISDLKNSSATGSKTINNIYFDASTPTLAYISCGQGLMVVDLSQDIILDVCNIGPSGSALNIYSTTIFNDTIYAATSTGIYKVSENDPDIQNYQHWQAIGSPLPSGPYNAIANCGNKMYAAFATHILNNSYLLDTLFVYSPGKWSIDTNIHDDIYSLESKTVNNNFYVTYAGYTNVNIIDTSGKIISRIYNWNSLNNINPNDVIIDNNMIFWIADNNNGLVKASSSYSLAPNYFPSGPYSNSMFAIAAENSTLYCAPGGYSDGDVPLAIGSIGISEYSNNTWYRLIDNASPDTIFNLCCLAIDPQNPLHAFGGSYDNGIVEYNNYAITNVYGTYNSTLQADPDDAQYSIRVGGVAFDTSGNLWASLSNADNNEYLSVKKANGTWQSFNFSSVASVPPDAKVTGLIVTQSGAKWLIFPGNGILAYQDNGTFATPNASNTVFITNAVGNGDLPSLNTYCLTQDLSGAIWVGNDAQVVVFYSPDNVFNGPGGWDAQNIYVQQTGYTQYLMQGQFTTNIVVDGANRKWIGTLGGGAFLMSSDGTQQLLNFTGSNSPLLSNNILSLAIDQANGEVFFGTDQGLVSYQGTATEGNTVFSNVYAYPDPVPHGYTGPIAIKNLVTNTDVKIANVNGEIVYHTVALGGQAIWYGTNFNGERVQTGVYLVFCTSPDGTQSFVTKLLLVN